MGLPLTPERPGKTSSLRLETTLLKLRRRERSDLPRSRLTSPRRPSLPRPPLPWLLLTLTSRRNLTSTPLLRRRLLSSRDSWKRARRNLTSSPVTSPRLRLLTRLLVVSWPVRSLLPSTPRRRPLLFGLLELPRPLKLPPMPLPFSRPQLPPPIRPMPLPELLRLPGMLPPRSRLLPPVPTPLPLLPSASPSRLPSMLTPPTLNSSRRVPPEE